MESQVHPNPTGRTRSNSASPSDPVNESPQNLAEVTPHPGGIEEKHKIPKLDVLGTQQRLLSTQNKNREWLSKYSSIFGSAVESFRCSQTARLAGSSSSSQTEGHSHSQDGSATARHLVSVTAHAWGRGSSVKDMVKLFDRQDSTDAEPQRLRRSSTCQINNKEGVKWRAAVAESSAPTARLVGDSKIILKWKKVGRDEGNSGDGGLLANPEKSHIPVSPFDDREGRWIRDGEGSWQPASARRVNLSQTTTCSDQKCDPDNVKEELTFESSEKDVVGREMLNVSATSPMTDEEGENADNPTPELNAPDGEGGPNNPKTKRGTHFVAFRIDDTRIVRNVKVFQEQIVSNHPHLGPAASNPDKLHLTMLVVSLAESEHKIAQEALQKGTAAFAAKHYAKLKQNPLSLSFSNSLVPDRRTDSPGDDTSPGLTSLESAESDASTKDSTSSEKFDFSLEFDFRSIGSFGTRVLYLTLPLEQKILLQALHVELAMAFAEAGIAIIGAGCGFNSVGTNLMTSAARTAEGKSNSKLQESTPAANAPPSESELTKPRPKNKCLLPTEVSNDHLKDLMERYLVAESISQKQTAVDSKLLKWYDSSSLKPPVFLPHVTLFKVSQVARKLKQVMKCKRSKLLMLPRYYHSFVQQALTSGVESFLVEHQASPNSYQRVFTSPPGCISYPLKSDFNVQHCGNRDMYSVCSPANNKFSSNFVALATQRERPRFSRSKTVDQAPNYSRYFPTQCNSFQECNSPEETSAAYWQQTSISTLDRYSPFSSREWSQEYPCNHGGSYAESYNSGACSSSQGFICQTPVTNLQFSGASYPPPPSDAIEADRFGNMRNYSAFCWSAGSCVPPYPPPMDYLVQGRWCRDARSQFSELDPPYFLSSPCNAPRSTMIPRSPSRRNYGDLYESVVTTSPLRESPFGMQSVDCIELLEMSHVDSDGYYKRICRFPLRLGLQLDDEDLAVSAVKNLSSTSETGPEFSEFVAPVSV